MAIAPPLYQVKDIRDRQIILQSPTGGMRVVNMDNLTEGVPTPFGVKFATSNVEYTVTTEDYQRIKSYLNSSN